MEKSHPTGLKSILIDHGRGLESLKTASCIYKMTIMDISYMRTLEKLQNYPEVILGTLKSNIHLFWGSCGHSGKKYVHVLEFETMYVIFISQVTSCLGLQEEEEL